MFVKLALRNVKRQLGNYLIYFMTVSFTVSLMFAISNIIFSENLAQHIMGKESLQFGLISVVVVISLIVAFVLSYATSFMLKLRKREFGTYLTLGMSRRSILSIFLYETIIICIVALVAGLSFGLFIYQGLMAIMMNLLEMQFSLATYSPKGLLLTVCLVVGIFLLASLTSAIYLKRVSIYHLIHAEKKTEKSVKYPSLWFAITILSFGLLIAGFFIFEDGIKKALLDPGAVSKIMWTFLMIIISIILFHVGLARSLIYILLRRKKLCSKSTNTFVLRQLSATLGSNSIMIGFLAFLLTFAIIGSNISFVQKAASESNLNRNNPYDIQMSSYSAKDPVIPIEEAEATIEKYVKIESKVSYGTYTSGKNDFYSQTRWSGEGHEELTDRFMKLSDFNKLIVPLGYEIINLQNEYMIIASVSELSRVFWNNFVYERNGVSCNFNSVALDYPVFQYEYFYVVVPDKVIEGMEQQVTCIAYDTENKSYNAQALRDELSYVHTEPDEEFQIYRCDYSIREYARQNHNSVNAILVIGALFIAAIFLFMAMSILALKTLSTLGDDKQRYDILNRLGVGRREQSRTLVWQTFSFFILPFLMPLLISIPVAIICVNLVALSSMTGLSTQIPIIAASVAAVMTIIYLLYYTATYLIAKKTVVHSTF